MSQAFTLTSLVDPVPPTQGGTGIVTYTTGDILYASASNTLSKLPIGTTGKVLTVNAGIPSWQAAAAASPLTTKGDLYGFSTLDARLPVGTDTHVLTADSSEALGVKWAAANIFAAGMLNSDGAGTISGRTITGTADFIDVADGTGVSGNPTLSINTKFEETGMHGWNGCLLETASVTAASDGATITFSVELNGGGDLDVVFSDGYYAWDTSPADTVTLTAGTDTVPVLNYVYLLQSTKTLTASTVGFPASEHAPLATILCQSAASFQTDGPYKFHAWTDHVITSFNEGHIADINFWIRKQQATYESGVEQTFTITTNGGAADNVILTTASGVVLQLHDQTFPAFSGTPDVYVVNDNATPYTKVTDLNALLTDSTGASMANGYFSLVIWGCVSENSADCKLFCNLPGGSYNSSSNLIADPDKYANFNIPSDFTGTGFLIAQWNLRHQNAASGTWTSIEEIDLRGLFPSIVPGGSSAFPSEFVDTAFRIFDDGDDTKKIAFQASGITTATTRTLTVQDSSGTIALTAETGGGTNQTTYTTGDILYSDASNSLDKLSAGQEGQSLYLKSGIPSWENQFAFFEEFHAPAGNQSKFAAAGGNGGTQTSVTGVAGHPGIVALNTGSTAANGRMRLIPSVLTSTVLGGGVMVFKGGVNVQDLSTAADEYQFIIGLGDGNTSGAQTDGVYFEYDRTTNTNWLATTVAGGTSTQTDTSVAVATSTWVNLTYVVNAGATSIEFFIDGVSVATNTTNIPSGACTPYIRILKSADSGSQRTVWTDYYYLNQMFTTSR